MEGAPSNLEAFGLVDPKAPHSEVGSRRLERMANQSVAGGVQQPAGGGRSVPNKHWRRVNHIWHDMGGSVRTNNPCQTCPTKRQLATSLVWTDLWSPGSRGFIAVAPSLAFPTMQTIHVYRPVSAFPAPGFPGVRPQGEGVRCRALDGAFVRWHLESQGARPRLLSG